MVKVGLMVFFSVPCRTFPVGDTSSLPKVYTSPFQYILRVTHVYTPSRFVLLRSGWIESQCTRQTRPLCRSVVTSGELVSPVTYSYRSMKRKRTLPGDHDQRTLRVVGKGLGK